MTIPERQAEAQPYLSVIAAPRGMGRDGLASLLARVGVLDEPTLRMRLGRDPPMIVAQVDPEIARRAVAAIRHEGGDAFAPTLDDLRSLGATSAIRDLHIGDGAIVATLWSGGDQRIAFTDIEIIVRAQLRSTEVRDISPSLDPTFGAAAGMYVVGPEVGVAMAAGGVWDRGRDVERRTVTSDKLDIHTRDRRVFQVDGDRFAFSVLGDMRGYSDRANMDRLCEQIEHVAPHAIVDRYYRLWNPPTGVQRMRLAASREDPAFAFYSRWVALMYRSITTAPGP
jgi:hypothetical protein